MSWIDFRKEKPETDIVAMVTNCKGYMWIEEATYRHKYNVWVHYDKAGGSNFTLDITHYLPIPELARE